MLARFLGSVVLAAAMFVPGTASANGNVVSLAPDATLTFVGWGAGHGVGMSQWGARGRALAGQSTDMILAAYYPGATLALRGDDSEPIRILMPSGRVQALPMRDYLASVVSSELPPDFPTAAVQAQAIASRTYALWESNPQRPFDVTSTVSTQAFGAATRSDSIAAVDATRGQVLAYAGRVIPAYFHDCSVGMTEDNANVWSGPQLPYLRAIDDRDANGIPYAQGCPRERWQSGPFSDSDLSRILRRDPRTDVGQVTALAFGARSMAGRWLDVTIVGDAGSKTVTLSVFRAVMNAGAPVGRIIFSADFSIDAGGFGPVLLANHHPAPVPDLPIVSFVL